jgi:hypothetical protein
MTLVKLLRDFDESETAERNALTHAPTASVLREGQIGALLETLEDGQAFLVEFGPDLPITCDWLGVLYATEVELQPSTAIAA